MKLSDKLFLTGLAPYLPGMFLPIGLVQSLVLTVAVLLIGCAASIWIDTDQI